MSTTYTPVYTDGTVVLAPYALIKADYYRVTFDARTKIWCQFKIAVGFGGSTDLTNGVDVRLYKCFDNDAAGKVIYGSLAWSQRTGTDPGTQLINNGSNYAAGSVSIAYDGGAGRTPVAGDLLCFWGTTSIPTGSGAVSPNHGVEFIVAGKGATTPYLLDTPTKWEHHDNEFIANAQAWDVGMPGGFVYALVFDYLDDAAGEAVCCAAAVTTLDSYTGT